MKQKNCLLLITHVLNKDIMNYFLHIENATKGLMDFFVLYDSNKIDDFPQSSINVYSYNSQELKGFFFKEQTKLPNTIVLLNFFAQEHVYSHYLVMEYDLILNGKFRDFIQKINSIEDIDYIHIGYDIEGAPDNHWPIQYIEKNPFQKLYFSWCHIFYISHCYLMDIRKFMAENDSFYYEFLLPTMAYNGNYVVQQFENLGYQFCVSWGPSDTYELLYKECARNNTFYHPIKDLSLVTFK